MPTVKDRRFLFHTPTLATPTQRTTFPFDRDFLKLWQECQRAGWEVGDWVFEFRLYGGGRKILCLDAISGTLDGSPFYLRTSRSDEGAQAIDGWNICGSLETIGMPPEPNNPALLVRVYGDLSGPSVALSVAPVWGPHAAEAFYHEHNRAERVNGDPRSRLLYRSTNEYDTDGHALTLENDTDCGREYSASFPEEPLALNVSSVYARCRDYVRRLAMRAATAPSKTCTVDDLMAQTPEPAPKGLELRTLLGFRHFKDRTNYESWRLVTLGVSQVPENPFPERAYDGFTWCVEAPLDPTLKDTAGRTLRISSDCEVVSVITPKVLNDIFVIDQAPAFEYRAKLWEDHTRLTNDEYNEFERMMARTLVPASSYKGNYTTPVWLIGRDLDPSEVRPMHKVAALNRDDRIAMKPEAEAVG